MNSQIKQGHAIPRRSRLFHATVELISLVIELPAGHAEVPLGDQTAANMLAAGKDETKEFSLTDVTTIRDFVVGAKSISCALDPSADQRRTQ